MMLERLCCRVSTALAPSRKHGRRLLWAHSVRLELDESSGQAVSDTSALREWTEVIAASASAPMIVKL